MHYDEDTADNKKLKRGMFVVMEKYKLEDFWKAEKEEAGKMALESYLPMVVKETGSFLVSEGVGTLVGEIVGSVLPVANNIRLSYKQNRLERNVVEALQIIQRRQIEIENRLSNIYQDNQEYQKQLTEVMLDNIVNEPQETMVKYNANGYVSLLKLDNTNIDIALMFFKTLAQLNDLDIRVLRTYAQIMNEGESILDICKDIQIDFEQMKFIKEKLERFGLLQSKNEQINDDNLDEIVQYLQTLDKERKKSKPKDVKIPRLKKISRTDSYSITALGKKYLSWIED